MEPDRISKLNDAQADAGGSYVLYWMQQSQRASFNPALECAVGMANERDQGVVVGFGLMEDYPEANERHFAFMLEGLAETAAALHDRGIKFVLRKGAPDEVALDLARAASCVVCDRGYLRHQKAWQRRVADEAGRMVVRVEGDVVVPVEAASGKREHAARTLRPKLTKRWDDYLTALSDGTPGVSSLTLPVTGDVDAHDPEAVLKSLNIDRSVGRVTRFTGGTGEARAQLTRFLRGSFAGYAQGRNDPADPQCSNLSPYLHFGQISPVEVALKARRAKSGSREDRSAFLEELIVRRELAVNFVHFGDDYDRFECLPNWAKKTLHEHRNDPRPHRYTRDELEAGATHDPYWNAAMREMVRTGYMHNYMRMYWGKKILEWCNTPKDAYATTLYLNNKYFLDGRDTNSYANVAWLFGLHDRAWTEREVFGKVRYMNANGLKRKFAIDDYAAWTETL